MDQDKSKEHYYLKTKLFQFRLNQIVLLQQFKTKVGKFASLLIITMVLTISQRLAMSLAIS